MRAIGMLITSTRGRIRPPEALFRTFPGARWWTTPGPGTRAGTCGSSWFISVNAMESSAVALKSWS